MDLLFDIGNSSVKWTLAEGGQINDYNYFCYQAGTLTRLLNEQITTEIKRPDAVLVSCVADNVTLNVLAEWVNQRWQLPLCCASVEKQYKRLINAYTEPTDMGVDRWLAMIAAWQHYGSDLCIVDSGTAMTIDMIEQSGQHLGGFIILGTDLMQKSLLQNTSKINAAIEKRASTDFANNTQEAISHGACLAALGAVNQAVKQFIRDMGRTPKCIITGGTASLLCDKFDYEFEHMPDLVFKGLVLVNKNNL